MRGRRGVFDIKYLDGMWNKRRGIIDRLLKR
jgi:hypothetical protein